MGFLWRALLKEQRIPSLNETSGSRTFSGFTPSKEMNRKRLHVRLFFSKKRDKSFQEIFKKFSKTFDFFEKFV
jgi:hypothetical protein